MIISIYITAMIVTWIGALYWIIRGVTVPPIEKFDWLFASSLAGCLAVMWPFVLIGIGPVIAVQWLIAKQENKPLKGEQ